MTIEAKLRMRINGCPLRMCCNLQSQCVVKTATSTNISIICTMSPVLFPESASFRGGRLQKAKIRKLGLTLNCQVLPQRPIPQQLKTNRETVNGTIRHRPAAPYSQQECIRWPKNNRPYTAEDAFLKSCSTSIRSLSPCCNIISPGYARHSSKARLLSYTSALFALQETIARIQQAQFQVTRQSGRQVGGKVQENVTALRNARHGPRIYPATQRIKPGGTKWLS